MRDGSKICDRTLSARIRSGDEAASKIVVDAMQGPLLAFFVKRLGAAGADDAAQETLIKAFRFIANGKFDESRSIETFVWGIARMDLKAIRRSLRKGQVPLEDWEQESFEEELLNRLEASSCLEKLDGLMRRTVELRFQQGLDAATVARMLDRKPQDIYNYTLKARDILHRCLEKKERSKGEGDKDQ